MELKLQNSLTQINKSNNQLKILEDSAENQKTRLIALQNENTMLKENISDLNNIQEKKITTIHSLESEIKELQTRLANTNNNSNTTNNPVSENSADSIQNQLAMALSFNERKRLSVIN